MSVTLETLEMTPEELESARETVRRMAYFDWLNAGRPECDGLDFWLKAERGWLDYYYVPNRQSNGPPSSS